MIDLDLELAAKIHYSFMPENHEDHQVDVNAKVRPLDVIGGDYCSMFRLDPQHLVLSICDAVGHGVASALFAARVNTFVLTHATPSTDPATLIRNLNEFLCQRLANYGMYSSFLTVLVDCERHTLSFAGAAHPPGILYRRSTREVVPLGSQTSLLGFSHPLRPDFESRLLRYQPGDRLVLYTDGLVETRHSNNISRSLDRLFRFTHENHTMDNSRFTEALFRDFLNVRKQSDDVLALVATFK